MMVLLLGMIAQATCWESERLRLVPAGCSDLTGKETASVRVGERLWLQPEVGSCCSPPGGPSNCRYSSADLTHAYPEPEALIITGLEGTSSITVTAQPTILPCAGRTVLSVEIAVPGSYWLGSGAVEVTP